MAALVLDTGVLLSLAVDQKFADAARVYWTESTIWVPRSVVDELRVRASATRNDIPPELPPRALGIVGSSAWGITVVEPTEDETKETQTLQRRLIGTSTSQHAGECEAAVLIASREPAAVLATDDPAAMPVLYQYVTSKTGLPLNYIHTSGVIAGLESAGVINSEERAAIENRLRAKQRPLI